MAHSIGRQKPEIKFSPKHQSKTLFRRLKIFVRPSRLNYLFTKISAKLKRI